MPYAERTQVPVERSRNEIERVLARYGASSFGYINDNGRSTVCFRIKDRVVRITVAQPPAKAGKGNWSPEQTARRLWRALSLVIKAKLEAVASGIATVEDEFLAYTVMPNGQTMAEWVAPQIATMIESGQMPKMLMAGT